MNTKTLPLISILILNWNRLEETKRAIDSALKQTYENKEIIVIDNHSEEKNTDTLPESYPQIKYYKTSKNWGCPGGRNFGIPYCDGEFIFYLDNDGVLDKNALTNAYQVFEKYKHVGIVTGKIIEFSNPNEIHENPVIENKSLYAYVFSGGVSMHRKSIYESIGTYNPDFMYGGEETNMSLRLLTQNLFVFYASNVILWHRLSDTARPKLFNFISSCSNIYHTYMQLMPIEFRIFYKFNFIFRYPLYAHRNKYLMAFFKALPTIFMRKLSPIPLWKKTKLSKKQTYTYKLLCKKNYSDFDTLQRDIDTYSYSKYLKLLI